METKLENGDKNCGYKNVYSNGKKEFEGTVELL